MPPRAVSRRSGFIARPTLFIAATTSSNGMRLSTPERARSAESTAFAAPIAFRLMQGHSTSPATGSHTRPITFLSAIAAACSACAGLPPESSTSAAAAMAAPVPVSAWQPPSAPLMLAPQAMSMPTAPAVRSPAQSAASLQPRDSAAVSSTPGRMPLAPAVGAATMRPMDAFTSTTAMLAATACAMGSPINARFA